MSSLWTWTDVELDLNWFIRNNILYQLQFPPVPHSYALISLPRAPRATLYPIENPTVQEASDYHHQICSAFVT